MPDLTVSATIDAFMQSATTGEARAAIDAAPHPRSKFSVLEHFLSGGNGLSFGLATAVSGGTASAQAITGKQGVIRLASGTAASATQRAAVTSGTAVGSIFWGAGIGEMSFRASVCPRTTLPDGTNQCAIRVGFGDNSTGEATDGAFFRASSSGLVFAVTRSNGVETAESTGVTLSLDQWYTLEVIVDANGTSVAFKVDGATTNTIGTNIPTGAGRSTGMFAQVIRAAAVATDCALDIDWIAFEHTAGSSLWAA